MSLLADWLDERKEEKRVPLAPQTWSVLQSIQSSDRYDTISWFMYTGTCSVSDCILLNMTNGRHHSIDQSISLRNSILIFTSHYLISNFNGKGDFGVSVERETKRRRQDGDGRVGETDCNPAVKCIGNNTHIFNLVLV